VKDTKILSILQEIGEYINIANETSQSYLRTGYIQRAKVKLERARKLVAKEGSPELQAEFNRVEQLVNNAYMPLSGFGEFSAEESAKKIRSLVLFILASCLIGGALGITLPKDREHAKTYAVGGVIGGIFWGTLIWSWQA
jgi:hypothetical protein